MAAEVLEGVLVAPEPRRGGHVGGELDVLGPRVREGEDERHQLVAAAVDLEVAEERPVDLALEAGRAFETVDGLNLLNALEGIDKPAEGHVAAGVSPSPDLAVEAGGVELGEAEESVLQVPLERVQDPGLRGDPRGISGLPVSPEVFGDGVAMDLQSLGDGPDGQALGVQLADL